MWSSIYRYKESEKHKAREREREGRGEAGCGIGRGWTGKGGGSEGFLGTFTGRKGPESVINLVPTYYSNNPFGFSLSGLELRVLQGSRVIQITE